MVKIERTPTPPESLAVEAMKTNGSYRESDVVQLLKKDSADKCYICELKNLSDPQVEHLRPHHNRKYKERVFDWNNLFYACPHCNLLKNVEKYEDKILDCCVVDPEEVLEHIFSDGYVRVNGKGNESVLLTADLIENSFEKRNTGVREAACQHRISKLADTMNILYKTLKKYKENPDKERYKRSLKEMLSRTSQFAAFKRYYVREHIVDYPGLKEYIL